MPSRPPQIFPLTSVRFFLAVWIVVFHESAYWGYFVGFAEGLRGSFYSLLHTAYVSVDIFFILSGFVLAYNYSLESRWTPEAWKRFAIARFARIYPAYAAGLFLFIPFVARGIYKTYTSTHAIHQAGVAVLNWGLLQSWLPSTPLTWNQAGWSVSDEAFFYCCFPIIGVWLWRFSSKRRLAVLYLAICAAALALPAIPILTGSHGLGDVGGTLVGIGHADGFGNFVLYNPLARLPEFCAGILLARIFAVLRQTNASLIGRGYWLYLPGLALETLALLEAKHLPYVFINNGVLLSVHALVILGFAFGGGSLAKALSLRWMVFLGDASYAIYIFHGPIKYWMEAATKALGLHLAGGGVGIVYLAIVLAFSCVFYGRIEKPLNRYLRAKLGAWIDRRRDAAPKQPETATA